MKYVYLAGSISGLTYEEANGWRTDPQFLAAIHAHGWEPVSPLEGLERLEGRGELDAWFEGGDSSCKAVWRDLTMIDCSSAVIAKLGPKASVGTLMEMGYAFRARKPIISVVNQHDWVHDHPFITELSRVVVRNLFEAASELAILEARSATLAT